jgi:hypothetical protein
MSPRHTPVFFYGLFMDPDLLRARGLAPANVRAARVPDMGLRIGRRAALVAQPGEVVHGFLMDLTHPEIDRLYAHPGVAAYRPEAVVAEAADGAVAALCYNLPEAPAPGETDPAYAASLRELAARLGLPAGYVDRIR